MTLPIDNDNLLGDFVPNVYISRVVLDYGTKSTTVRGDDPHIDIPTEEQFQQMAQPDQAQPAAPLQGDGLSVAPQPGVGGAIGGAFQVGFEGLYGTEKKKTTISTFNPDGNPEDDNSPLTVRLDLVVKDVIENKFLSNWFNVEKLKKYINIAVVQSTSVKWTSYLDNINSDFLSLLTPADKAVQIQVINLGEIFPEAGEGKTKTTGQTTIIEYDPRRFNSYEYTTNDLGQRVYNITFSVTFEVEKGNVDHLSYFATTEVDKKFFEDSFDPPIPLPDTFGVFDKLTGRKIFEPVIKNGKAVTEASYYSDNNGEVWLGKITTIYKSFAFSAAGGTLPTYLSQGEYDALTPEQKEKVQIVILKANYVEGEENDSILTEQKIPNTKIQDFRQSKMISKIDIDFSEPNKLYEQKPIDFSKFKKQKLADSQGWHSALWAARDRNNRINFSFAIDTQAVLTACSPYSKLWDNLTDQQKYYVLANGLIKEMVLVRKRVTAIDNDDYFDENLPVESIANLDWEQGDRGRLFKMSIKPAAADDSYQYCFFSGYDEDIKDVTDGFYQYGVKFTFTDTLEKLINQKIKFVDDSLKAAKQFYSIATLPQYYNLISDTYTSLFKQEQSQEFYGIFPDLLADFDVLYTMMANNPSSKPENFLTNMLNICSPASGTPDGLEFIINLVENFLNQVKSTLSTSGIVNNSDGNNYNPAGVKSSKKDRALSGETYFKEIFDANNRNRGYDFLTFPGFEEIENNSGLKTISYNIFDQRATEENLKYFTDESAVVPLALNFKNIGKTIETDLIKNKHTFLSPSMIKLPESGQLFTLPYEDTPNTPGYLLLSSPETIQYKKLNTFYLEIIRNYLIGQNAGMVNPTVASKFLTIEDLKQKALLTDVLSAKGVSYGLAATEGIPAKEVLTQQLLENDEGTALAEQPQIEKDEQTILTPQFPEEPNYNDALLFLSEADGKSSSQNFFTQFDKFIERIKGTDVKESDKTPGKIFQLPVEVKDLENIPNHYKQLIVQQKDALAVLNTDLIKDNLNLLNLPEIPDAILEDLKAKQFYFGIFVNYFNLVKIEYLSDFTSNLQGESWSEMNSFTFSKASAQNKVLLCRMKYYSNEKLGVMLDDEVQLPIFDQYFILAPGDAVGLPDYTGAVDKTKSLIDMAKAKKATEDVPPELTNALPPGEKKKQEAKNKQTQMQGNTNFGGGFFGGQGPGGNY
jgi:hypothetical protein